MKWIYLLQWLYSKRNTNEKEDIDLWKVYFMVKSHGKMFYLSYSKHFASQNYSRILPMSIYILDGSGKRQSYVEYSLIKKSGAF